ncbi:hypothetical protein GmHk_02G003832 [Glycine max]|nr:hypothetical protein GmHk_02G003832 [Glycine max]
MVRTRGLCRALGKVVGRALGREDNRDSDESLQQRRPTTSARRHREIAAVAEESPHLDDAAEEVFQQPEGVVVDDQGFPGGPRDTSVLTAYADHVVVIVCNGELSSYGRQVHKFGRPATEIEGPLVQHKETSSFHLPVGEVVITLNDVASLLHLPIIGAFHSFETLHVDEAVLMLVELREVSEDEVKAQTVQCHGAYCWIYEHFPSVAEGFTDEDYDERSPCAYHWTYTKALPASTYRKRLDRLTTANVCWMPYGAIMQLETLTRFHVFLDIFDGIPLLSYTDQRGLCGNLDYMEWFYMILHPFMRLTQLGDPPKHPPIVQDETYVEPDMPQYLVVAAAMEEAFAHAPSDLEQPRHAMEACQAIAERLERLFNLRIVTEGTKTYVVMQDCLRIARGVTVDHNFELLLLHWLSTLRTCNFIVLFHRRAAKAYSSARRQQEAAPVVEDDPVVTEDLHAHAEEAVDDFEGLPGGLRDPSVLTDYGDHVAVILWNGEERPELKLSSHGRKVQKFGRHVPEIEGLVAATGLSPLIPCAFHSFETLHVDEAILMLVELLEVPGEEARAETIQCHGAYIRLSWLQDIYQSKYYDEMSPRACRWIATKASSKSLPASRYQKRLDGLTIVDVCWMPYAQPVDLARHPPVTQDDTYVEPHIPEVPVAPAAAPTHAPSDEEQPRHAMEACQEIAERFERLLNLRIVNAGTKIHEVMEDCLRIARGVTVDGNVYVRSRRRQHTDQP